MMKAVFTFTSAESKRLIAKAVVQMPGFKTAWEKAYVLLADGTTNAFIAQKLLGRDGIESAQCTIGLSTDGLLCATPPDSRKSFPNVFYHGEAVDKSMAEALSDFHVETMVIKGANAVDPNGCIGIIAAGFDGGAVPRIISPVTSKGLELIVPVGLETLVPSVPQSAKALGGAAQIDISMGADSGMFCLFNTTVITEIEAHKILFNADATLVCCGGVGGNEGAITLAVDSKETDIKSLVEYLEQNIKGEPPIKGNKGVCETCRYKFCRYNGLKSDKLHRWMEKKDTR